MGWVPDIDCSSNHIWFFLYKNAKDFLEHTVDYTCRMGLLSDTVVRTVLNVEKGFRRRLE